MNCGRKETAHLYDTAEERTSYEELREMRDLQKDMSDRCVLHDAGANTQSLSASKLRRLIQLEAKYLE